MQKDHKKRLWMLLYLVINLGVLLWIALSDDFINQALPSLKNILPWWVAAAAGCMLVYLLADSMMLHILLRKKISFGKSLYVGTIGRYYSAVTPMASGGGPFQVYSLYKFGVSAGESSAVIMMKFVVYQITVSALTALAFAFGGADFYRNDPLLFYCAVVGLAISFGGPVVMLTAGQNLKRLQKLVAKLLMFGARLRLVRDPNAKLEQLNTSRKDLHRALQSLLHAPWTLLQLVISALTAQMGYLLIIYCIYRAFGFYQDNLLHMMCMSLLLQIAVAFVPTPGASGGSEYGFARLFITYFGDTIFLPMLLWRMISYYSILLMGACILLRDTIRAWRRGGKAASREEMTLAVEALQEQEERAQAEAARGKSSPGAGTAPDAGDGPDAEDKPGAGTGPNAEAEPVAGVEPDVEAAPDAESGARMVPDAGAMPGAEVEPGAKAGLSAEAMPSEGIAPDAQALSEQPLDEG